MNCSHIDPIVASTVYSSESHPLSDGSEPGTIYTYFESVSTQDSPHRSGHQKGTSNDEHPSPLTFLSASKCCCETKVTRKIVDAEAVANSEMQSNIDRDQIENEQQYNKHICQLI